MLVPTCAGLYSGVAVVTVGAQLAVVSLRVELTLEARAVDWITTARHVHLYVVVTAAEA